MSISCLIHVNTHRVKEGARVLEDIARFVLRDKILFKNIRKLRHSLQTTQPSDNTQSDFGGLLLKEDNIRSNLIHIVQANSLRMQEGLRVLEEITQDYTKKQKIKSFRYMAYDLQQEFYKKTILFTRKNKLKGLYLIIDTDIISLPIKMITKIVNQSSVNIVQFRSKLLSKRLFLKNALRFKELLHPDKLFMINDHVDIALDIADGVHLGQQDYPLKRVRKLVPDNFLLGVTCHNIEEARLAENSDASYLSIGCLFPTRSKKNALPTSLIELQKIQQTAQIPICAIGGIDIKNLPIILSYKTDMIALISSVWNEPNPGLTIESMQEQILSKLSCK